MNNPHNTNHDFQEETLVTQNGTETTLQTFELDVTASEKDLSKLSKLNKSKGITPKYFEFTLSVDMVEKSYQDELKQAKNDKQREEARSFYEKSLKKTAQRFLFKGYTQRRDENSKLITYIVLENETGFYLNQGAQLVRVFQTLNIPIGTAVEIEFLREEAVMTKEGASVKIYEVYLLS